MSCFRPWFRDVATGEWSRSWIDGRKVADVNGVKLPCGRCAGCITDRAHHWGVRVEHESKEHDHNVFLTLTYDDQHLPYGGSLVRRDAQLFLKRLGKQYGDGIRYFGCGEYGEHTYRPHYHLCLFNVRFPDRKKYDGEHDTSESLSKLWREGTHKIADLTVRRCYYTAGYVAKKLKRRDEDYDVVDFETGEVLVEREKEFTMCSTRPAIGQAWFDRYQSDLKLGHLTHNGKKIPIPRFYLKKMKAADPELFDLTFCKGISKVRSDEELYAAEYIFRQKQMLFRKPLPNEV